MNEFHFRTLTDAEVLAIRARAERMRAEAIREMFAALRAAVARLFARTEAKAAGKEAGAH